MTMGSTSSQTTSRAPPNASSPPKGSCFSLKATTRHFRNEKRTLEGAENQQNDTSCKRSRTAETGGAKARPFSQRGADMSSGSVEPRHSGVLRRGASVPSSSNTSVSFRSETTEIFPVSNASNRNLPEHIVGIGLMRIPVSLDVALLPVSLIATSGDDVSELVPDSVLGRNASTNAAATDGKIDLGIGPDATGVSRKQLRINSIGLGREASVEIKAMTKTPNDVAIFRYDPAEQDMSKRELLSAGSSAVLRPGDVLVMDEYRRPSCHAFRVVAMTGATGGVAVDVSPLHGTIIHASVLETQDTESFALSAVAAAGEQTPVVPSEETTGEDEANHTPVGINKSITPTIKRKSTPDGKLTPSKVFALRHGDAVFREPRVGDYFRVVFDYNPGPCGIFGRDPFNWYIGCASRVDMKTKRVGRKKDTIERWWTLHLKFEDEDKEFSVDYQCSGVVQILTGTDDGQFFVEFPPSDDGTSPARELVYDKNPEELYPGDLVECFAQNGLYLPNKWFRGRVMSVDSMAHTCDVVYDDGDCEVSIPMRQSKIRLLGRGYANLAWLENLKVPFRKGRRNGTIVKIGQYGYSDAEYDKVRVKIVSGKRFEIQTYEEAVASLLGSLRKKAQAGKGVLEWPDDESSERSNAGKRDKRATTKLAAAKKKSTVPVATKKAAPKRKAADKPRAGGKRHDREVLWDAPDEMSSHFLDKEVDLSGLEASISREKEPCEASTLTNAMSLRPTLANAAIRALNSAEPHLGAELLTHYAFVDGKIPQGNQMKKLFDAMKLGPQSNGTFYPDSSKMALTSDFVLKIVRDASLSTSVVNSTPQSWHDLKSYLLQIDAELYCTEVDFCSASSASLTRVGKSLHVMACGLDLVATLMETQLGPVMRDPDAASSNKYRDVPIVKALRDQGHGHTRDSLKFIAHALAKFWRKFGHFVLNEFLDDKLLDVVEGGTLRRCTSEARRCVQALGSVCCFAAWVHCAEQNVTLGANDVAILVKNEILNALDSSEVDLRPFFGVKAGQPKFIDFYWKRSKFRLVLALNADFIRPLQVGVAKQLHVLDEYMFVTGHFT